MIFFSLTLYNNLHSTTLLWSIAPPAMRSSLKPKLRMHYYSSIGWNIFCIMTKHANRTAKNSISFINGFIHSWHHVSPAYMKNMHTQLLLQKHAYTAVINTNMEY